MIRDRIRRGVRRVKRGIARRLFDPSDSVVSAAPVSAPASPFAAPPVPPAAPEPVEEEPGADVPPMTLETVEALFDDMVRPALQADGGDIQLVRVDGFDVHVRLMGACSSCPSSTVTMKMGVERLLEEEFPQFRNLIQVPA